MRELKDKLLELREEAGISSPELMSKMIGEKLGIENTLHANTIRKYELRYTS